MSAIHQRLFQTTASAVTLALSTLLSLGSASAQSNALLEPPVFRSANGVLDLLMVARPNGVSDALILGQQVPLGWVYEICNRPSATATSCNGARGTVASYGGSRLALQPGDKLKIKLVNKLPPIPEAKHGVDDPNLYLNPTNLHTHGLIVEARYPTVKRPTWGDNVYVSAFNPANGVPTKLLTAAHSHGDVSFEPVEYEIDIPANHPQGSYWFHPHIHGVSLNQLSAGLSGIITIGRSANYICEDDSCKQPWRGSNVRNIIIKDSMIEQSSTANATLLDQEDPSFCTQTKDPSNPADVDRRGSCAGQVNGNSGDHSFGRWFMTLNGQVYPTVNISSAKGELWRLTNTSGSATYDLRLQGPGDTDMIFEVVSVDGVAVTTGGGVTTADIKKIAGGKIKVVDCPVGATTVALPTDVLAPAVCATGVRMMPSSRVELRVAYRDANGRVAKPPLGAKAVFRTIGYSTGPAGDSWPAIDLAQVNFLPFATSEPMADHIRVKIPASRHFEAGGIFNGATSTASPATASANCLRPLPPGNHRRIYYGIPLSNSNAFGLAYEEIAADGSSVTGKPTDVVQFDPNTPIVCLQLGKGNVPVKEVWELINIAGEDHNFHIHQTKFRVLSDPYAQPLPPVGTKISTNPPTLPYPKGSILHDNLPLITDPTPGQTCDGTFPTVASGGCNPKPVIIEIAFSQVGDFVYHCHILEHEDGGMMSRISVLPNP